MSLTIGSRLGPYEILSPLGAGGMGEVYRARDTRLNRDVAIKVLPEEFAQDADRLARFEREAKAVAALNHPNILSIYDFGKEGDTAYSVTEFLEGETLRERLSSGALPVRKAVECATQIAKGLAAAHDKGIVHRDLKPENLFFTKEGQIKILDFGLAAFAPAPDSSDTKSPTLTRQTEPGTLMGTVGYMSPEQARGKPADQRSDLFSLGAVLYEMLSGRRAFQGESQADVLSAILKEHPNELQDVVPAVPGILDRVIQRCLEKDPADRFQSARDLAFSLGEASGTSAAGAHPAKVQNLHANRLRAWLWPSVAGFLLLLGFAAGWAALTRGKNHPAVPEFQRLTFRQGLIGRARFSPDGREIVCSGAWNGGPMKVYTASLHGGDVADLALEANLLAVSSQGDLAIQLAPSRWGMFLSGNLARVPMDGTSPRVLLENVQEADWAPSGQELAVLRRTESDHFLIEYPLGHPLLDAVSDVTCLRVSPDGKWIAALVGDALTLIDRGGKTRSLATVAGFQGLAWTPDSTAVRFASREPGGATGLWSVPLSGQRRLIYRTAGAVTLYDEGPAGDLLGFENLRNEVRVQTEGGAREQDFSWLARSDVVRISSDGKLLLLNEYGAGGPSDCAFYLRYLDGSPPVKLGEGQALDLSQDGKTVLAYPRQHEVEGFPLLFVPVGAGSTRTLRLAGFERLYTVQFFPDGKRLLIHGSLKGREQRFFSANLDGGALRPLTPKGTSHWAYQNPLSYDGQTICAYSGVHGNIRVLLCPVEGGTPRLLPNYVQGDVIASWSGDGRYLYAFRRDQIPASVLRIEVATGKREVWRVIAPANTAGVPGISGIHLTPDGATVAYSFRRSLEDLYLMKGLR